VRNMLRRGDLRTVRRGRCRDVDIAQCLDLVREEPLAFEVLLGMVEGRYEAPPATGGLDDAPLSLTRALQRLR
jgi:hypothetical protein